MSKPLTQRDAYGLHTVFYRTDGTAWANKIRKLLQEKPGKRELDPLGVKGYFDQTPHPYRTCFKDIYALRPGHCLERQNHGFHQKQICPTAEDSLPGTDAESSLASCLRRSLLESLSSESPYALALSGGLDSALILALLTQITGSSIPCVILSPQFPEYNEAEAALRTAEHFQANVTLIEANEEDFLQALPETVFHAEVPLFNLHPVSKYLLAQELAKKGIQLIFTGDGADQVFAGAPAENYLPIVGALFEAKNLKMGTPFLDPRVIGFANRQERDPNKSLLRNTAKGLVPDELLVKRKVPRYAPPMDLQEYLDLAYIRITADKLGFSLAQQLNPSDQTKWATLTLLAKQLINTGGE